MEYMFADPAFRALILMAQRRPLALCGDNVGVAEAHTEPPATIAPLAAVQQEQLAITWQEPPAVTWQGQSSAATEAPPSTGGDPDVWSRPDIPVGRGSNRGRRNRSAYHWLVCQDARPSCGASQDRQGEEPAPTGLWSNPGMAVHDVMAAPAAQIPAKPLHKDAATNTDPLGVEEEEVEPAEQEEPTPEIYPGWKEALVLAVKEIIPRRGSDGRKFQEVYIGKTVQPPGGGEPYLVSAHVNINYNPNAKVTSWARILEGLIRAQAFSFTRDRLGSAVPFSTRCLKAGAGQRLIISLRPLRQAAGI